MTPVEIRLQCLALARPADLRNEHDAALIVARARQFLAFVEEAGPVPAKTPLSLPVQNGDRAKGVKAT